MKMLLVFAPQSEDQNIVNVLPGISNQKISEDIINFFRKKIKNLNYIEFLRRYSQFIAN